MPLRDATCESSADVLDVLGVRDGLLEQLADVVVVQVVDDASAVALADHESEMSQQTKLMGNRRRRPRVR
jgi:hypothetical protein